MKRSVFTICAMAGLILAAVMVSSCKKKDKKTNPDPTPTVTYGPNEIYHYSYMSIDSVPVNISSYAGKKIMFVNTASFCGNTPQYEKLEALYKTYSSKLVIIGFPCNQFGNQEPADNSTIEEFCTNTYGITFPMSGKIDVKGPHQDSIYTWLTNKDMNGVLSSTVEWNFQKYLVDEKGQFVAMFPDSMQPDDPKIIEAINE